MENLEIMKLEAIHAKELSTMAHDIFKVTYEDKLEGKFEKENFKIYLKNAFAHVQMMNEITAENSKYFGVFKAEILIAYLKVNCLSNQTMERPENHVEIERFYVLPFYQGQGLGKLMLDWITNWAREKNYVRLWLRTWERNDGGIAFYKKMGLKVMGTTTYKFEESDDVDFVLEKEI